MDISELTIRKILTRIANGEIRIPSFQRGFVWDAERVAYFMDSIYKQYPFGSLLFWHSREQLRSERRLGSFELPPKPPEYPLYYVLDGQQRITSIFGVFQTDLKPERTEDWMQVYFDLAADAHASESQFVALSPADVEPGRYFPLRVLFDSVAYRQATEHFTPEQVKRIDAMQSVFQETRIPVQVIEARERATVAIVFERVNRKGVELDTLQLLSAWTWSEEFHLQAAFAELAKELAPFGFHDVGEDSTLLLRCCAAVLVGDATPEKLVALRGDEVRSRFEEAANGIRGAIDFLRAELHVETLDNLPFTTLIVPLSVFFAIKGTAHVRISDEQRRRLHRWLWKTCFSRRYSSGTLRYLKEDIEGMRKLREGEATNVDGFAVNISPGFYSENPFRVDSVNTKTFILQLAQHKPLSFVSGANVELGDVLRAYNRHEFHHLYPRAYLKARTGVRADPDCLANFAFLSKADNVRIGKQAPSQYRGMMSTNVDKILAHAVCPPSLFSDDFETFVSERSALLVEDAKALIH